MQCGHLKVLILRFDEPELAGSAIFVVLAEDSVLSLDVDLFP